MDKLILIKNLNLPDEINHEIKIFYKYEMLKDKYKKDYRKTIDHMKYYFFLNKRTLIKEGVDESIVKTIKEFDYYQR